MSSQLSVVIPAYNAEAFIESALASIAGQTVLPLDVVVVDDGSTDNTGRVVRSWIANAAPNFEITVHAQANGGLPAARNAGIRRTKGKWVALLDADDIWEPDHLAVLDEALAAAPGAVAAYGAGRLLHNGKLDEKPYDEYWDNPSRVFGKKISPESQFLRLDFGAFSRLIKGNFIKPSSLMFLRETAERIGLFNESLRTAEDRDFLVRLLRAGDFIYAPKPITRYLWHSDNISQTKNAKRNSENGLRALKVIGDNAELKLDKIERAALNSCILDAAEGYLYLCACANWTEYRRGLRFLRESFNRRVPMQATKLRHIAKLVLRM